MWGWLHYYRSLNDQLLFLRFHYKLQDLSILIEQGNPGPNTIIPTPVDIYPYVLSTARCKKAQQNSSYEQNIMLVC